jgi:hypothetical protein
MVEAPVVSDFKTEQDGQTSAILKGTPLKPDRTTLQDKVERIG